MSQQHMEPSQMPTEKEMERNRLLGIIEGASARTIFNLTSGAFLVGLLKYMGASDTVCGYILAVPVLAAVIQFLSPIVLERLKFRLSIITLCASAHRALLTSLIIIPFLPIPKNGKLIITFIVFLLSYAAVSFANPAVSNMYVSFVPQNMRGRYFGKRESYLLFSATVVSLVLGKVLDVYEAKDSEITGYLIVYGVIFVFTIINHFSLRAMKEVPLIHTVEPIRIREIFTLPFKDKTFIVYFIMSIIWNISIQVASAFFAVYFKSDLNMNYTTITTLGMVNSLTYVVTASFWGRFADRHSWARTSMLTIGILAVTHFLWFLCFKGSPMLLILLAIAHVFGGIAWSGINVSLFNLQFDFTPNEKRTVYIGLNAATSGIIGYLAAILGSQLVSFFGHAPIVLFGAGFDIKQVLFLVSSTLLFVCAAYIGLFMNRRKKNV